MPKIVIFNRDDSALPNYERESYHRFDVVDIIPDDVDIGTDVKPPTFLIVETDTPIEDLQYLKEPHINIAAAEYDTLHRRLYSLDNMMAQVGAREHYKTTLLATGKVAVPDADVRDLLSLYLRTKP